MKLSSTRNRQEAGRTSPQSGIGGAMEPRPRRAMRRALRAAGGLREQQQMLRPRGGPLAQIQAPHRGVEGAAPAQDVARAGVKGSGSEIPFRAEMEQLLGLDLSGTRAHFGAGSASAARALGTDGYALGEDVVFASPNPDRDLVAHELAHVVQRRAGGAGGGGAGRTHRGDGVEQGADAIVRAARGGQPLPSGAGMGLGADVIAGSWRVAQDDVVWIVDYDPGSQRVVAFLDGIRGPEGESQSIDDADAMTYESYLLSAELVAQRLGLPPGSLLGDGRQNARGRVVFEAADPATLELLEEQVGRAVEEDLLSEEGPETLGHPATPAEPQVESPGSGVGSGHREPPLPTEPQRRPPPAHLRARGPLASRYRPHPLAPLETERSRPDPTSAVSDAAHVVSPEMERPQAQVVRTAPVPEAPGAEFDRLWVESHNDISTALGHYGRLASEGSQAGVGRVFSGIEDSQRWEALGVSVGLQLAGVAVGSVFGPVGSFVADRASTVINEALAAESRSVGALKQAINGELQRRITNLTSASDCAENAAVFERARGAVYRRYLDQQQAGLEGDALTADIRVFARTLVQNVEAVRGQYSSAVYAAYSGPVRSGLLSNAADLQRGLRPPPSFNPNQRPMAEEERRRIMDERLQGSY